MYKPDDWKLHYEDLRTTTKMLVPLPADMLRDLRIYAKWHGVTRSELVRQAVTAFMAPGISAHPHAALSFRGRPVQEQSTPESGPNIEPQSE